MIELSKVEKMGQWLKGKGIPEWLLIIMAGYGIVSIKQLHTQIIADHELVRSNKEAIIALQSVAEGFRDAMIEMKVIQKTMALNQQVLTGNQQLLLDERIRSRTTPK